MDIDRIRGAISQMKLPEKLALVGGGEVTSPVPRLNIPSMDMGDGLDPYFSCEPTALALGCTFSPMLCAATSKLRSAAAVAGGKAFSGAIACGLMRDPMRPDACDFFSEDAFVAKELLCAYASAGELGYVFTDALGQGRFSNRTVDARALYELYLYPLERAGSYAAAIMLDGGYLNGVRVASSRESFDMYAKLVPSHAMFITPSGYACGADTVTGGGAYQLGCDGGDKKSVARAVVDGRIFENRLNACIERTVATVVKTHEFYKNRRQTNAPVKNIVVDSTVLLKNDGLLPANPKNVTIFGNADRFDDGASFRMLPFKDAAKKYGAFNLFLITDYGENGIPADVSAAVCAAGTAAPTVVALCGGAAAELPVEKYANAVLFCPYCPTVSAVIAMITNTSPRGHLPFTWLKRRADYPINNKKFSERGDFRYDSVYNGYRLFNNYAFDVMYPFGHGLSYTTFEISRLMLSCDNLRVRAEFVVKNTGEYAGSALVQLYITLLGGSVYGQSKRLAAFRRVPLDVTENAKVAVEIDIGDFTIYDEANACFCPIGGKYRVDVGLSSTDIRARGEIKVPAGSRVSAGLTSALAPSYYASGKAFEPTAPEIERLLKVPFIKKPDEYPDIAPPPAQKIKHLVKRAEKTAEKRVAQIVKYKIENTPVK